MPQMAEVDDELAHVLSLLPAGATATPLDRFASSEFVGYGLGTSALDQPVGVVRERGRGPRLLAQWSVDQGAVETPTRVAGARPDVAERRLANGSRSFRPTFCVTPVRGPRVERRELPLRFRPPSQAREEPDLPDEIVGVDRLHEHSLWSDGELLLIPRRFCADGDHRDSVSCALLKPVDKVGASRRAEIDDEHVGAPRELLGERKPPHPIARDEHAKAPA